MPVYLDNMRLPYKRMIMCHMIADTTEELLEMADKIGVQRKWIQEEGTKREHFDICLEKRALAVKNGAQEEGFYALIRERLQKKGEIKC
jgi:hypothetical protein